METQGTQAVEIVPSASALIQSLRGLGYTPETALADLIDNSITAGASAISIHFDWNGGAPVVATLDDGGGLDFDTLIAAMQFGGGGPLAERGPADLGRFGLGLKTASLSQCRRMTIATRKNGKLSCLAWDVDIVAATGRWNAIVIETIPPIPLLEAFGGRDNGTLVVWERMDAIGGLYGLDEDGFFARIQTVRAHLSMVFHRFLSGDARRIAVAVNGRQVRGWDPFQRQHPATIPMPRERIRSGSRYVEVVPYILPHRDRFANDAEYEAAGGPGGWGERQGFYVYRGKRLISGGGWLGLGGTRAWTREEASRPARICIDLLPDADADWRIDIRKSQARPPAALRARLTAVASACREKAREVFAWRGGRVRGSGGAVSEPVWISENAAGRLRYRLNREHPLLKELTSGSTSDHRMFETAFLLIEKTVPVERIWLDVSQNGDAKPMALAATEIETLAASLAQLVSAMPETDSPEIRLDRLLQPLPVETAELRKSVLRILGELK